MSQIDSDASRRQAGSEARPPSPLLVLVPLLLLAGLASACGPPAELDPDSQLIECDQADQRVELTSSAHLDPACTYTGGFDITASNVTLDCQGALIQGVPGTSLRGIQIEAPEGADLEHVTVRDCRVEGFLNSLRILREGFRSLPEGGEYVNETRDVTIERNLLKDSRGVGLYVDAYVSDVTVRDNVITGAGSTGIYLETGSRRNRIERNFLVDNGFRENGPNGQLFRLAGIDFWFWGVGREGIAVDGSYENTIRLNTFSGNSAGGIFLYKNCGEYPDSPRYFERRTHSDHNRIVGNVFWGGRNGVWVASRMAENTYPMECTDTPYYTAPVRSVVLDYAADNVILGNVFHDVTYGVRVEDDGNRVESNFFFADSPDHHAVIIGTPYRTDLLGLPVRDTVLRGNVSEIEGNSSPYRWVHGEENTQVAWNFAEGRLAPFCEGESVPRQGLIFVTAFTVAGPGGTPPATTPDLTVPTLGALPPCS